MTLGDPAVWIAIGTVTLRSFITVPVTMYTLRQESRLMNLMPLLRSLGAAVPQGKIPAQVPQQRNHQNAHQIQRILSRHGVHGRLPLLAAITAQFPVFLAATWTLRNYLTCDNDGKTEWISWIKYSSMVGDLSTPAPTLIAPLLLGAVHILNFDLNETANRLKQGRPSAFRLLFLGMGIMSVPIASTVPMGITVYWLTSAMFSLAQNLALRSPFIRRRLRLPPIRQQAPPPSR